MTLSWNQPLMKMSTRYIPGGKGGRCVRLTTSPPSCAEYLENLGAKTSWSRLVYTGPVTGLLYLCTYIYIYIYIYLFIYIYIYIYIHIHEYIYAGVTMKSLYFYIHSLCICST